MGLPAVLEGPGAKSCEQRSQTPERIKKKKKNVSVTIDHVKTCLDNPVVLFTNELQTSFNTSEMYRWNEEGPTISS